MSNRTSIQRLLQETQRGRPLDSEMLRDMGISAALAHDLVKSGWLQHLSRGAYLMTGDVPSRDGTIAFLSRRVPGMHVAGKTALSWQGVRHNIAFRERVVLWGQKPYAFPDWVGEHLLYSYQTTTLYDDDFLYGEGLKPLPSGDPAVLVSIPERALLELASDVGKGQTLEEARNLMVGLRNIRPQVLDKFLSHCTRVKVVRLVRDLGAEAGFSWAQDLQKHVDRLGHGKRWTHKTKDGKRLTLKPQ
ncbi:MULTISPECIES: type IV toxin-antitoxin system AbiEi family antitoxin domain-containing protein [Caballeronia]|uniref:type IV toxin-antitoxin system AbiEi family antitoxin domain-containing protein n=1 Tax=Caballeronia TaxID=1827195 RepID=UPI001FD15422|nr:MULTISPECIES: type IV toxin-antitoxin system AbiEi family antitoxin domain-containing protein [Caballeronia]MDR5798988.1 type IV toxin-antitoxin system AbiEi family antitoxin domain-containing protein [Caballeronia sp. LZ001]